jgi:protein-L-isoaspartate(D-aspartate) O-methyltransferase
MYGVLGMVALLAVGCSGRPEPASPPPTPTPRAAEPTVAMTQHAEARRAMVADQIESRGVRDPRTLAVMRDVPRHDFVPPDLAASAYRDHPLPIAHEQTISQPYIVALMTETLQVEPGQRVLEVGTGSGYQACVLGRLGADVYTIEIVEPLARQAESAIAAVGCGKVQVRAGDGYRGWPEAAPFDRIMVTAAAPRVPEPLVQQLKEGGRLVLPVGEPAGEQYLRVLVKKDGRVDDKPLIPVRFVPMTGEVQQKQR